MKKLLIILMVVAMASFLFVGCLGVTPDIDEEVAVTGVTLVPATLALTAGGATGTLVATVAPADATDPRVTWASSAPAVATVVLGVVTPLTAGTAVITVTTVDGGFTDTCIVTVSAAPAEPVAVTGVTLDEATLALTVGDAAVTLVATVAPATATDPSIIWASSDKTVAIVALGVVTPLNAGISAITATTVDGGFVATCVVTVTAEGVPAPTSTTPTILDIQDSDGDSIVDLTSTKTQYINKTEAGTSILVTGIAGPKALVQVYIGDTATPVAAGEAGKTGLFSIVVAETALGADSLVAKTLHATSTELGLAESAASNVATFILDTVAPSIKTSSAKGSTSGLVSVVNEIEEVGTTEELFADWEVVDADLLVHGAWNITLADVDFLGGGEFKITFVVTDPLDEETTHIFYIDTEYATEYTIIPGISFYFPYHTTISVNDYVDINVTTEWQGKDQGYIDVTFDGDVTSVSILEGVWTVATNWWIATSPTHWFDVSVKSNAVARISSWDLDAGDMYFISCIGIEDLAGNSIPATAPSTDTGSIVAQ